MTFRSRLIVVFLCATLTPLIVMGLWVRHEMTQRLTAQYERRAEAMVRVAEEDFVRARTNVRASLSELATTMANDGRLRRAMATEDTLEASYLRDYAARTMPVAGLAMLQIQDRAGRILSSGQARDDYDRVDATLPALLDLGPDRCALVPTPTPGGSFLALACVDSATWGSEYLTLVGGVEAEARFLQGLARDDAIHVSLSLPYDSAATDTDAIRGVVRTTLIPFADVERGVLEDATLRVVHDTRELDALRANIDRLFVVAIALAALVAVLAALWIASRLSKPLVDLAEKTSRVDLNTLDVDFSSRRSDEIGTLATTLGALTSRLRENTVQLKDAERRASFGDLARQVNHDIKNGLTPIRNVLRHLSQQSRDDATQLSRAFEERRATLDASIDYLENLAVNYARMSRRGERVRSDLNSIVRSVASDRHDPPRVVIAIHLVANAVVWGDDVSLRRIVENLVSNAIESLEGGHGTVTLTTEIVHRDRGEARVRLIVADTGRGMDAAVQSRVFDDFYTTKSDGTGLGLSIVRRLAMDADATVAVESEVGRGSRFIVDFPAAEMGSRKVES